MLGSFSTDQMDILCLNCSWRALKRFHVSNQSRGGDFWCTSRAGFHLMMEIKIIIIEKIIRKQKVNDEQKWSNEKALRETRGEVRRMAGKCCELSSENLFLGFLSCTRFVELNFLFSALKIFNLFCLCFLNRGRKREGLKS